jgi:hypothetical protein
MRLWEGAVEIIANCQLKTAMSRNLQLSVFNFQFPRFAQPFLGIRGAAAFGAGVRWLSDNLREQRKVILQLRLRPVANLFRGWVFICQGCSAD